MRKYSSYLSIVVIVLLLMQNISCVQVRRPKSNENYTGGEYVCISLSQFMNRLNMIIDSGLAVPEEMASLYGMSWLEGYMIDKENFDIILVGKCNKERPAYHAEDIIINIQNVIDSVSAPYCSLDPNPDNILNFNMMLAQNFTNGFEIKYDDLSRAIGDQKIIIGGVPLNSRHAKNMIYADYDMKKISQGLLKVHGIRSCLDFSVEDTTDENREFSTMSRFWLHIKESKNGYYYPNFNYSEGIVFIDECPVVILTEKQIIDLEGKLQDNLMEKDEIANAFAAEMSENYDTLAIQNYLFAELENLFRLQACLRAMVYRNDISTSGDILKYALSFKLGEGNELPESLPGLVNYKIIDKETDYKDRKEYLRKFFLVAGGVDQSFKIERNSMNIKNSLSKLRIFISKSRHESDTIYWTTGHDVSRN